MAGDLAVAGFARRLVAERQRAERQRRGESAADAVRRVGIVIAGDPEPVAAALQRGERRAVGRRAMRNGPPPSWKLSPSAITSRGA